MFLRFFFGLNLSFLAYTQSLEEQISRTIMPFCLIPFQASSYREL